MEVLLSLDHIVQLIDSGKLHNLPEFTVVKNHILKGYDSIAKLGGFSTKPLPGCSSCRQKKIKYAKSRLIAAVGMHLNMLIATDTPLSHLIAAISELEGQQITKLNISLPTANRQLAKTSPYKIEEHKTRYTRSLKKSNGETIVLKSRTQ